MRIALLADHAPCAAEGSSVVVHHLARSLEARGCEVHVLALDSRVPSVPLLHRLRMARVDAAVYTPRSGLTTAALVRARLLAAVAPSLAVQILQADAEPALVPAVLRPRLAIFPSQRLARAAGTGLRAVVVPIGVDRARLACDAGAADGLWPEKPGPRMLHVGHIRRSRNLDALASLAVRGANVLLVASPDTAQNDALRRRLEDAGVAVHRARVTDMAAVYRAADLYVFPVTDVRGCIETPMSALESLAVGTPVVATPFGVLPELEVRGLVLAAPEDVVDVALATAAVPPQVDSNSVPTAEEFAESAIAALRADQLDAHPRLVVLLGVDGTGKSTQAHLLTIDAATRGVRAVAVWSRWKPFIVRPFMATARRVSAASAAAGTNSYERQMTFKRRVFRLAFVRHLWQWVASFDHGVQTIPRIVRAGRNANLVIADRYYHDALVDMGANFGSSAPAPRGFFRLFPKPDCVIVLDAPEAVVFKRKDDVPSIDYLRQRRPLYLQLARAHGWPIVDATRPPDQVHEDVSHIVWSAR
jgi:dTMP kinase